MHGSTDATSGVPSGHDDAATLEAQYVLGPPKSATRDEAPTPLSISRKLTSRKPCVRAASASDESMGSSVTGVNGCPDRIQDSAEGLQPRVDGALHLSAILPCSAAHPDPIQQDITPKPVLSPDEASDA